MMFTYIVSTTLRFDKFIEQIYQIAMCKSIGEIIIINNSGTKFHTEDLGDMFSGIKNITIFNPIKKLLLNDSWNLGMEASAKKYTYAILSNDDIMYDTSVIDLVALQIESIPKLGVLGIDYNTIDNQDSRKLDYVYIDKADTQREYGFGLLMFLKKSNYTKIPKELRQFYGDDFIYYSMLDKGLSNYLIKSDTFRIKKCVDTHSNYGNLVAFDKQHWMKNYFYKYLKYGTRCL